MKSLTALLFCILLCGCIESFVPESISEVPRDLVVDAPITDEITLQRIQLSRSNALEEEDIIPERGASVSVSDEQGNRFQFRENQAGEYISETPFGAVSGRSYKLNISTAEGTSYESEWEGFLGGATVDSLYAERITDDLGVEGMAIFIDSFDPSGEAEFYRFEYEESYRIVAPFWASQDIKFETGVGFFFEPRPLDEQVCYSTDLSTEIILEKSTDLNENRLERFLIRFIDRNNYIITHRYTILVRQLVHSERANRYFETLKILSDSESVFSENQPGFLNGNIFSLEDPSQPVLGYFEVASVAEKRIFFSYEDFFPGEELPDYVDPCQENEPDPTFIPGMIAVNSIKFLRDNEEPQLGEGPYVLVVRVCGDCTVLGQPEIPDFWVEE